MKVKLDDDQKERAREGRALIWENLGRWAVDAKRKEAAKAATSEKRTERLETRHSWAVGIRWGLLALFVLVAPFVIKSWARTVGVWELWVSLWPSPWMAHWFNLLIAGALVCAVAFPLVTLLALRLVPKPDEPEIEEVDLRVIAPIEEHVLNADTVAATLQGAGIPSLNAAFEELERERKEARKAGQTVREIPNPVQGIKVQKDGDRTIIAAELPARPKIVTVAHVQDKHATIAAGLKVPAPQLFIQEGSHGRDLRMTVLAEPFSSVELPPSPWDKDRLADYHPNIFENVQVGFNEQLVPVYTRPLALRSTLTVGGSGSGKTTAARNRAGQFVLDAQVQPRLWVFAPKITGWAPFRPIADEMLVGPSYSDALEVLQAFKWVLKNRDRINRLIDDGTIPRDLLNGGDAVTREAVIWALGKGIDIRPLRIWWDEPAITWKALEAAGDKENHRLLAFIVNELGATGRSSAQSVQLIAQQVTKEYIPGGALDNVGVREVLAVEDVHSAKAALGGVLAGYPRPDFFGDGVDVPMGQAAYKGGTSKLVRFPNFDLDEADRLVAEAVRRRQHLNFGITGYAAGEPMFSGQPDEAEQSSGSLLKDLVDWWPSNADGSPADFLTTKQAVELLATNAPDQYPASTSAKAFAAQLRGAGLAAVQTGKERRMSIRYEHLQKANEQEASETAALSAMAGEWEEEMAREEAA